MFARLEQRDEIGFVPFLVLGDPDRATSLELVRTLAASGADALELGLPFSDPIADGPVIQAAANRALSAGVTREQCWAIVTRVRSEFPAIPIGLLVYANLVLGRHTGRSFHQAAADAGVDSVLVADLPLLEAGPVHAEARRHGLAPVLIAPPNVEAGRLEQIARESEAFVYVTSRPGVTGADQRLNQDGARVIAKLRQAGSRPPLLGFGIAEPVHVREARGLGAAGAISGSAVVRRVVNHLGRAGEMVEAVASFVGEMKSATCSNRELPL
jgi:tryptophan synthase alpha chain